jgi:hypothetical protein
MRKFGTEIANTSSIQISGPISQPGGVKKSSTIKNKFFDNKAALKIEEKLPQDVEMDVEYEEEKDEKDFEMGVETVISNDMEVDASPSPEAKSEDTDKEILEDAKSKRAERRKAILKELEVCDLLDL